MDNQTVNPSLSKVSFKKQSQAKDIWRRFRKNRSAMIGMVIFLILLLLILSAPLWGTYEESLEVRMQDKCISPNAEHPFGTDQFGRDVFLRIVHGGKYSLIIGISTSLISMFFGCIFGSLAGFYGGKFDDILMRIMDMFSAIPTIMLALAIVSALGSTVPNLIAALAISRIPGFTRIVRSSALSVVDQEYMEAAKAGGASSLHIILKHLLPNCLGPIIVQATMNVSLMIVQTASMSFLGLGIIPPTPEWGAMISDAKSFIRTQPYLIMFPGAFLVLISMAINLLGDGLRDALDPKLKN